MVIWNGQAGKPNTDPDSAPDYLAQIIRMKPPTDPMANMDIELKVIPFNTEPEDQRNNILSTSDTSTSYPKFTVNDKDTGIVYDGDFDGVPFIFDPNDSDNNITGNEGMMMAGGSEGGMPSMGGGMGEGVDVILLSGICLHYRRQDSQERK